MNNRKQRNGLQAVPIRYAVCVLVVLATQLPTSALAARYAYTLTGDQFVSMMNRPSPLSTADYMEREKAYSYLDGVRDSAEGRVWCDVNELKTHDLAQDLAARLAKLPADRRKKNASLLLLAELKRAHPCRATKGQS